MALILDQEPAKYTPAYNQSPWVIRETDGSGTINDWRMVISVLAGRAIPFQLVSTFNIRFRENTSRRVVFDPSEVLKNLVNYDLSPVTTDGPWELATNTPIWYSLAMTSQKYIGGEWVNQNLLISDIKTVWNAALDEYDFIDYDIADYISYQAVQLNPLTNFIPTLTRISTTDSYWVQFLSEEVQAPLKMKIITYSLPDLQGSILTSTDRFNQYGVGFTGYPLVDGNEFTRRSVRAGIGTRDLSQTSVPISFSGVQSYKVTFSSTGDVGGSTEVEFSFNVTDCSKYPPTRLHWLNSLGGFDSWTFGMKSRTNDKIDRKQFYSQKNVLTAGTYGYDSQSRGTTDYHIGITSETTLNTDLLTDAELENLRGLISSPAVFMETGTNGYKAVSVVTKSWRQKRGQQDGTFNLELEIKPSIDNSRQRG